MAEITIDSKTLEELIDKSVQKHLKLTFEDMEEVRRSPAAAIVRLETRLDAMEKNMVTKADLANLRTELIERIGYVETTLNDRIGRVETTFNERIAKVETTLGERIAKLETGQKLLFALVLSMFGTLGAMLVKLVFFP